MSARAEVRPLLSLALPVAGGLLVSGGLITIESLFLGHLGPLPLAAMSLTGSALNIPYYLVWGLLYPLGAWIGRGHGAGDARQVAIELRHALVLAAAAGGLTALAVAAGWWLLPLMGQPPEVLAILKPYWMMSAASMLPYALICALRSFLEAIERQDMALWFGLVLLAIAVPLHYALIFGLGPLPAMGLTGAGIALLMSEWLAILVFAAVLARQPRFAAYRLAPAIERAVLWRQLVEGMPVGLQNLFVGTAYTAVGIMIGRMGAMPLAANQVVMNVFGLVYMLPIALSTAVMIRVAQAHGQGRTGDSRAIGHAAFAVSLVQGLIVAAGLVLLARPLAEAFTDEPEVIALSILGFQALAAMQLADAMMCVAQGAVIGMGDSRWPTRVLGQGFWLVSVPCAAVCGLWLGGGMAGAWAGFSLGLVLAAVRLTRRFEALNRPPLAPPLA